MTHADVQALEALRDQWRADAEAKHRAEYQDNQVVREVFPRITTIEIRRWLKCADELDVLLHGAVGLQIEEQKDHTRVDTMGKGQDSPTAGKD